MDEIAQRFKQIKAIHEQGSQEIERLKQELDQLQQTHEDKIQEMVDQLHLTGINENYLKDFLVEPYALLPTGKKEEWYVVVPKFIRMNLGWLDFTTSSYNVFRINKFMDWLGEIPQDIREKFKFKPKMPLKIYDGMLLTGKEHQDQAWDRYKPFLLRREGSEKIRVKKDYEFKLIAKLIDDGILPFIAQPVDDHDLYKTKTTTIDLSKRDYQKEAWKKFLQTGAIGVFWSYSAGKSIFGAYACARVKGKKLVVVPTVTLVQQWENRLRNLTEIANEVDVVTYHSFKKVQNNEYALTIFDECHHLPANTFAKFSTINTKYRIGLSGSPYREDNRSEFIFALSGFPVGLSWENLIELGIIEKPDIRLYLFHKWQDKEQKLDELLAIDKKTLVFVENINTGKHLAKKYELPFVYGDTKDRIDVIEKSNITIVSRVADEGISIPNIERVIEYQFMFGSRRQESQRMGRLLHGKSKGEHIILMTEVEYEKYNKRFMALYEKGFKVEIVR